MNAVTIASSQNTTGDWLNIQNMGTSYRVIGQRINYVRGKNVVKWAVVKDGLTIDEAKKLFAKKIAGKKV
jgi:hypothetical protein